MLFEDFKGDIKLHIGCDKEYLEDWINVNKNPENINLTCDASWDLASIVFWKKHSVDVIYIEDFLDDLNVNEKNVDMMLATYKHILKPEGHLIIGLDAAEYSHRLAPWLNKLGLKNISFFDVSDISNKKYIS